MWVDLRVRKIGGRISRKIDFEKIETAALEREEKLWADGDGKLNSKGVCYKRLEVYGESLTIDFFVEHPTKPHVCVAY